MLTVIEPGPLAVLEDAGRAGYAHLGIPRSGPVDRASHTLANTLVGNAPGAAAIEILIGPFEAETTRPGWIAVTGAAATVTIGGVPVAQAAAVPVGAGERIRIGRLTGGLRCYVAIGGGCIRRDESGNAIGLVAGSAAWDSLSKLGTPPLVVGDQVEAAEPGSGAQDKRKAERGDRAPQRMINPAIIMSAEREFVPVVLGPRHDWFTDRAIDEFFTREWQVSSDTDRIGARLAFSGAPLDRAKVGELPSEGMVEGAVQITSDGTPIVFLADHPVTGGYPVIAVATREGIDRVGQAPPGTSIRFVRAR